MGVLVCIHINIPKPKESLQVCVFMDIGLLRLSSIQKRRWFMYQIPRSAVSFLHITHIHPHQNE